MTNISLRRSLARVCLAAALLAIGAGDARSANFPDGIWKPSQGGRVPDFELLVEPGVARLSWPTPGIWDGPPRICWYTLKLATLRTGKATWQIVDATPAADWCTELKGGFAELEHSGGRNGFLMIGAGRQRYGTPVSLK